MEEGGGDAEAKLEKRVSARRFRRPDPATATVSACRRLTRRRSEASDLGGSEGVRGGGRGVIDHNQGGHIQGTGARISGAAVSVSTAESPNRRSFLSGTAPIKGPRSSRAMDRPEGGGLRGQKPASPLTQTRSI